MIVVGIGANLPAKGYADARSTCTAALESFASHGIDIQSLSPWYASAPVPVSDQPWYVNAVASVATMHDPRGLLDALHTIESVFGRARGVRNAARTLDLDLLDYEGRIEPSNGPILPHPRMRERAFVLLPLRDIAPDWRHPVSGECVDALIDRLPLGQEIRRLPENV